MYKKNKVKVLQTIRQGQVGGGETHVLDLAEALNKDLYEPVVLSFTDGPMVERLQVLGIKTHVIHTTKPFDFTKWNQVKQLLISEEIDLVHAHGTRANSNVFWSAKRLHLPIIYTVHGWSFHPDQNPLTKLYRTLSERFLIHSSDYTICVSDSNLKDGQQKFKMDNATVIKNGINQDKFNSNRNFKNIRAEFGVSADTVLIGYIARISAQKDPFTLLKAIALIPQELDIKVLFVGEGDLKEDAIKMAKQLEITSRIIFSNFRLDIPDILNALDIYCLPSLWEGLPIGLLEAMAMKKAVVATAIDGTRELINHRQNGLLIPPMSPEILAESLTLLIQDPALRDALSVEAQQTIKANYSVEHMTWQVEQLYDRILGINRPAHRQQFEDVLKPS